MPSALRADDVRAHLCNHVRAILESVDGVARSGVSVVRHLVSVVRELSLW